jgi:murein DD-endopeptidase MepM/ murein hydrolase activator NlpD
VITRTTDSIRVLQSFLLEDRYSEHKHVLARESRSGTMEVTVDSAVIASAPVAPSPSTLTYTKVEIPIRIDTVAVTGNLSTNLYEAFISKGETPALIQLVTKIFAWDVDFFKDPRVGDAFNLLVEKRYGEDGNFRGYGQVLSAKYVNRGKEFYGILYKGAYFDQQGGSLEKMLLKVPLNFAHVSSGFTSSRLHPILGVNRPHWGVDYAAPKGTKIFAAGDGTIEYAKWVNGYGKTMKIRHNGVYNTYYAHLNGFASGMSAGRRVKQGEVVAFLGMTGMATGPHLDYRVECHGSYINPASLKMEAKEGVAKAEWKEFCDHRDLLLARMVSSEFKHFASAY